MKPDISHYELRKRAQANLSLGWIYWILGVVVVFLTIEDDGVPSRLDREWFLPGTNGIDVVHEAPQESQEV